MTRRPELVLALVLLAALAYIAATAREPLATWQKPAPIVKQVGP